MQGGVAVVCRLVTILALTLFAAITQASLYKHVDAEGNVSYSDQPREHNQQLQLEDNGNVSGMPEPPQALPKVQASQKQADFLEKLNQHQKKVEQALTEAKVRKQELEGERQKCMAARRVGIRDLRHCAELEGDKKAQCIENAPVEYKITTPENCTPPAFEQTQGYIQQLETLRQEDSEKRQQLLQAFPDLAEED